MGNGRYNIIYNCQLPGSSVGIATDYRLDGPGSNPGEDNIFRPSRLALGPTQPPIQWLRGFSRDRGGRGVELTPHLECRGPRKSTAIPLLTLRVFVDYKKGENVPTIANIFVNLFVF